MNNTKQQYVLVVTDWDDHFESGRTLDLKRRRFLMTPLSFGGHRIAQLIDRLGPGGYGVWVALCTLVAEWPEVRGAFTAKTGTPYTLSAIASKLPFDADAVHRCVEVALDLDMLRVVVARGEPMPKTSAELVASDSDGSRRIGTEVSLDWIGLDLTRHDPRGGDRGGDGTRQPAASPPGAGAHLEDDDPPPPGVPLDENGMFITDCVDESTIYGLARHCGHSEAETDEAWEWLVGALLELADAPTMSRRTMDAVRLRWQRQIIQHPSHDPMASARKIVNVIDDWTESALPAATTRTPPEFREFLTDDRWFGGSPWDWASLMGFGDRYPEGLVNAGAPRWADDTDALGYCDGTVWTNPDDVEPHQIVTLEEMGIDLDGEAPDGDVLSEVAA